MDKQNKHTALRARNAVQSPNGGSVAVCIMYALNGTEYHCEFVGWYVWYANLVVMAISGQVKLVWSGEEIKSGWCRLGG